MTKNIKIFITMLMITILSISNFAYADKVHRVASGEALYSIATSYGTTTKNLIDYNLFLKNPNILYSNQVLIIPETKSSVYQVQSGDSLYKISQKLGVSMVSIAETNKLSNWNSLYVGQQLSIPSNVANSYTVKSGDTLYLISQKLGVSISDISQENNLTNVNYLYVGQVLKIPNTAPNPVPVKSNFQILVESLAEKHPDTFYYKGSSNLRRVSLTFDDGPDELYTPQVLDILKAHNVKATFFLVGSKVKDKPELVNRILKEGHVIANHTWTHPDLRKISEEQVISEMQQTEDEIKKVTGLTTAIMRPPFGGINDSVIAQLKELDYKVINWNIDSVDYSAGITADKILINTLPKVTEDSIILMHDAYGDKSATVKALPELIRTLKLNGYSFVTTDEMLNIKAYR